MARDKTFQPIDGIIKLICDTISDLELEEFEQEDVKWTTIGLLRILPNILVKYSDGEIMDIIKTLGEEQIQTIEEIYAEAKAKFILKNIMEICK